MSGLDKNMLLVIECLAKNRIQDAKKAAIACCANDTTKKNQRQINYCKNLLNTGSLELTTLPASLQGLIHIQDVSDFPENRYYVGTVQRQLYDKIYPMRRKTPCFSYGDIRRVHRIYASN